MVSCSLGRVPESPYLWMLPSQADELPSRFARPRPNKAAAAQRVEFVSPTLETEELVALQVR